MFWKVLILISPAKTACSMTNMKTNQGWENMQSAAAEHETAVCPTHRQLMRQSKSTAVTLHSTDDAWRQEQNLRYN